MVLVRRESIYADISDKAFAFNLLLRCVVTREAQRLQLTKPEELRIAMVRYDVISRVGRHDNAVLQTCRAERVLLQLHSSTIAPTLETIPSSPRPLWCWR